MNVLVSAILAMSGGQLQGNPAALGSVSNLAPLKAGLNSQKTGEIVLGKLGQATLQCDIYAKPDIGSRVYYTVKVQDYLVVDTAKEPGWVKVLLQNNTYGFVQADSVKVMEYRVTTSKKAQDAKLANAVGLARAAELALRKIGPVSDDDLDSGIFVQRTFAEIGVKLSADPEKQSKVGKAIAKLEKLQKGDRLYFWVEEAEKIGEVGIYYGDGHFIYLNEVSGEVETQYLGEQKWLKRLVAARR